MVRACQSLLLQITEGESVEDEHSLSQLMVNVALGVSEKLNDEIWQGVWKASRCHKEFT